MPTTIALDDLRRFETTFCRGIADVVERPYGLLYHAPTNPLSHDANHAVITDRRADPQAVVRDVTRFYTARGVEPRVYSALYRDELARLHPALALEGYTVQTLAWRLFVWQGGPLAWEGGAARAPEALEVRRVTALDDDLVALINSDGEAPWTVLSVERHLRSADFDLLVGYAAGKPVTMASLKAMEGLSRVDDVLTHPAHRGHGYARALMAFLVRYHQEHSTNALYLFADSPTAIRVYRDVGFAEQPLPVTVWMAWRPPLPARFR